MSAQYVLFLHTWGPDILLVISIARQFVEEEIVQTVLSDVTLYGDDVRLQGLDQQQDLVGGGETLLQGGVHLETSQVQVEWRHLTTSLSHAGCDWWLLTGRLWGSSCQPQPLSFTCSIDDHWSGWLSEFTISKILLTFLDPSQYHITISHHTIKTITQRVHRSQAVQIRSRFIKWIYYCQGRIYLLLHAKVLFLTTGSSVKASVLILFHQICL